MVDSRAAHKEVLLMSELYMLSKLQIRRIEPYFPLSHGVARVDDPDIERDYLRDQERPALA